MGIKFIDRTNPDIDNLLEISWKSSRSHTNEVILTRPQDESDLSQSINDKIDDPEVFEGAIPINLTQSGQIQSFDQASTPHPSKIIIAVDTGIAHLGEFVGGGIAFAVRGAAFCLIDDGILLLRYNTGPILADQNNVIPMFRYIGKRLGNETLYLDKLNNDNYVVKQGVLSNTNQIQDRFRNYVERMIHEEAIGIMLNNKQGLLLIDGALPTGTFDTPASYVNEMLDTTAKNHINVAAISKKTRISIGGKPLSALFDEQPAFVGYMPLKEVIRAEREELVKQGIARSVDDITAGNELYAARFGLGPPALTFRVDVKNSRRSTPAEVIETVYSDCMIHGCYPKPLIEAHQHSSFLFSDVQLLLADLVVRTGAKPKERQSMDWLFAPIGSFGK